MAIDLDNLTKEDFLEMAKYVHSMELRVQQMKAEMLALATQRDNAQFKLNQLSSQVITPITNIPKKAKLTDELDLVNPEQYRIKKQF
jgi:hypothetical protein